MNKLTLKIIPLFLLFILFNNRTQAQIFAGNDSLICGTGNINLNATIAPLYGTNLYTFEIIPYAPEVYGGTPVPFSSSFIDDAVSLPLTIPFEFCFFGQVYTTCYVGSNGWVSFSPGQPTTYTSASIPSQSFSVPKNCIMGPWEDWDPSVGAGPYVFYYVTGVAPNRKFVINWDNSPMFWCNSTLGKFQIVLCEFSNEIYNHLTNKPTCFLWAGGTGTQGVHNFNGFDAFTAPGRNSTQWQAQLESTRFIPGDIIPPAQIQWFDTAGNVIGNGPAITVNPTTTTSYIAGISSCTGALYTDTVTFTLDAASLSMGVASYLNVDCFGGNTANAIVEVTGGSTPYSFDWSTGVSAVVNQPSNEITNLSAGVYSCTVTWGGGCSESIQFTVTQNDIMSAIASTTPESCPGAVDGTVTITINNGQSPFTYNLSTFPTSPPQPLSNYTFTGVPSGNYNITVTDVYGCTALSGAVVDELSLDISANNTLISCHGDTNASAIVTVIGGTPPYSYDWSNGYTTQGITNLAAGTYFVTATDINGCTIDTLVSFSEPDPLILYTSGDQTICLSQYANIVSTCVGGTTPYNFIWSNGFSSSMITVSPSSSSTYCVYSIDSAGCYSNEKCVTVNVNPKLSINLSTDVNYSSMTDIICKGDTATIWAELSGGNGGPYFFNVYNGAAISPPYDVWPESNQEYIIIGTDGCGTPSVSDTVMIEVLEAPTIKFKSNEIKGCQPLEIQFINETESSNELSYQWDFHDSEFLNYSILRNPKHTFVNEGIYDVSLRITTEDGCVRDFTNEEMIKVFAKPEARFSASPEIVSIIQPEISFENLSIDADTWFWIFGDGDSLMIENIKHSFPEIGKYLVTLIAQKTYDNTVTCIDTAYTEVEIEDQSTIYFPNVINPYSRIQENRVFHPLGHGIQVEDYHLLIYNRWGELVFETDDSFLPWDGKVKNGEYGGIGSYVWILNYIDYSGIKQTKTGNISIVK